MRLTGVDKIQLDGNLPSTWPPRGLSVLLLKPIETHHMLHFQENYENVRILNNSENNNYSPCPGNRDILTNTRKHTHTRIHKEEQQSAHGRVAEISEHTRTHTHT